MLAKVTSQPELTLLLCISPVFSVSPPVDCVRQCVLRYLVKQSDGHLGEPSTFAVLAVGVGVVPVSTRWGGLNQHLASLADAPDRPDLCAILTLAVEWTVPEFSNKTAPLAGVPLVPIYTVMAPIILMMGA